MRWSDKNRHLISFPKRIAVIRLRSLPPAYVNVTAVGQIPRIEILFLPVAAPADTRLADIIKSSPHKITDHVRVIEYVHPAIECFQGVRFRPEHDPFENAIVVKLVKTFLHVIAAGRVVVTRYVQRGEI